MYPRYGHSHGTSPVSLRWYGRTAYRTSHRVTISLVALFLLVPQVSLVGNGTHPVTFTWSPLPQARTSASASSPFEGREFKCRRMRVARTFMPKAGVKDANDARCKDLPPAWRKLVRKQARHLQNHSIPGIAANTLYIDENGNPFLLMPTSGKYQHYNGSVSSFFAKNGRAARLFGRFGELSSLFELPSVLVQLSFGDVPRDSRAHTGLPTLTLYGWEHNSIPIITYPVMKGVHSKNRL
mmetsp:Transcript_12560/g.48935  ORF Transcript_12560/g.48935 Transcript_12560/m.48935 type:complete len:239 (-) Transcript_12560:191-907(-)